MDTRIDIDVAVVGAGPAGLMAAETVARSGARVVVLERMASAGRKLLLAGRGGLNLTHGEPLDVFLSRYGAARSRIEPLIRGFTPADLVNWAEGLGQSTFVGSSGRVFPTAMKASPLLRAWLARLREAGVEFRFRHRLEGLGDDGGLLLSTGAGEMTVVRAKTVVLALGGASWPRLGADGSWVAILSARGVAIRPLQPANCGAEVAWTSHFRERFAGAPLKRIALRLDDREVKGEAVVTRSGLEGGAVYLLSADLRDRLAAGSPVTLTVDLKPDIATAELTARLARPRGKASLANHLRKAAGLSPVAIGLLREAGGASLPADPAALAGLVKALPLPVSGVASLERAISTAGGVAWDEVDARLMLHKVPGVFVAGEMLDWEAPTGGYLLQACFASGVAAGEGAAAWLQRR